MRSSVIEQQISVVQETIRAIRDIRSKYNKPPSEVLKVSARAGEESADILKTNAELINQLAQVELLEVPESFEVREPFVVDSKDVGKIEVFEVHQAG